MTRRCAKKIVLRELRTHYYSGRGMEWLYRRAKRLWRPSFPGYAPGKARIGHYVTATLVAGGEARQGILAAVMPDGTVWLQGKHESYRCNRVVAVLRDSHLFSDTRAWVEEWRRTMMLGAPC